MLRALCKIIVISNVRSYIRFAQSLLYAVKINLLSQLKKCLIVDEKNEQINKKYIIVWLKEKNVFSFNYTNPWTGLSFWFCIYNCMYIYIYPTKKKV